MREGKGWTNVVEAIKSGFDLEYRSVSRRADLERERLTCSLYALTCSTFFLSSCLSSNISNNLSNCRYTHCQLSDFIQPIWTRTWAILYFFLIFASHSARDPLDSTPTPSGKPGSSIIPSLTRNRKSLRSRRSSKASAGSSTVSSATSGRVWTEAKSVE